MILSKVSPSSREKEKQSLNSIFNSIEKKESIIFNAGAGAGKTYALIQSLKYVIRNYEKNLTKHNQKIICITYTNVATTEVKERLGNTNLVLVSTIHERIWALIKDYQKELLEIHKEKLEEVIYSLNSKLEMDKDYTQYQKLGPEEKEIFKKIMIENKKLFYQNYTVKAAELKESFNILLNNYSNMLRNVNNFRKIVNTIYKIEKYRECYANIVSDKLRTKPVEYNSIYNSDKLEEMKISHDSLIEYGLKIINKYDLLKQIIIDKYPFIFVDEYQDTDEKIVLIMSCLEEYAKKIGHKMFIGYFGDTAQNIYEGGAGSKVNEIHLGLKPINKEFNRRSTQEVIEVLNKIRNDEIEQTSIYEDCKGGSVRFYKGTAEDVNGFIDEYINKWRVTPQNQLHCLVLTNKIVAEYSGFKNIYDVFRETDKYKDLNYNLLNTELLSNDLSKLGEIPKLLFNIIKLHYNLKNPKTLVTEISPKASLFDNMNLEGLRNLLKLLKQIKGKTLGEYIESISTLYIESNEETYKNYMDLTLGLKDITFELFKNHLNEKLFRYNTDEDISRANEIIQRLLEIEIKEYESWYKFVEENNEEKVVYHTYHATKGREYDNVIIIMGNAFGKNKNYFSFFFQNFKCSEALEDKDKQQFEKIKNLLYVSCSRAIKNLRILYIDDVSNFESGIKEIFGKVNPYK